MSKKRNVRISAKAIIFNHNKILLVHYKSRSDEWYTLPGGGQFFGEPLNLTLVRECLEETGFSIEPGKLVYVRDYIGANHEFSEFDRDVHQVELIFLASIVEDTLNFQKAEVILDKDQIGTQWVAIEDLDKTPLFPICLKPLISKIIPTADCPVYLGDVN